jgi:hypothetical protein
MEKTINITNLDRQVLEFAIGLIEQTKLPEKRKVEIVAAFNECHYAEMAEDQERFKNAISELNKCNQSYWGYGK